MKKIVIFLLALIFAFASVNARTFALCTGVSNYDRGLNPLSQSTKDAKSMAAIFKAKAKDTSLITGKNATVSNISNLLTKIARAAGPNDQIFFFFSGHGGTDVFCLYDKNMSYYDLLSILSQSKCCNILVMIDACESGSLASAVSRLKSAGKWQGNIASIVSSRASENSMENSMVGAGLLAQGLMKAFRGKADANADKKLTVTELFKYTFADVTSRSSRTSHTHHPQLIAPREMQQNVVWNW